ncbi:DUF167 domain-containing protein [candidate division WOR-3 bacterium]|nr:DUF167 domain-containing protein [candidate division WOR-3 bacterium]
MRTGVLVKPGASADEVTRRADGTLVVRVRARAREGEANEAVVRVVARHFCIPKTGIRIVAGHRSRTKFLELPDNVFQTTLPIIG